MRRTKGQVKIDFIFSLIFFTIMIFYIAVQLNSFLLSSMSDSKLDTLKSEANILLETLISSKGNPENWEALPENQITRIGLASIPYSISSSKLDVLKNNCDLMNKFGSINYKLSISSAGSILLSCGYGGPKVTSKSEMPVLVNGGYGKATLELW